MDNYDLTDDRQLQDMVVCGGCDTITHRATKHTCTNCGMMLCGKCGEYCDYCRDGGRKVAIQQLQRLVDAHRKYAFVCCVASCWCNEVQELVCMLEQETEA